MRSLINPFSVLRHVNLWDVAAFDAGGDAGPGGDEGMNENATPDDAPAAPAAPSAPDGGAAAAEAAAEAEAAAAAAAEASIGYGQGQVDPGLAAAAGLGPSAPDADVGLGDYGGAGFDGGDFGVSGVGGLGEGSGLGDYGNAGFDGGDSGVSSIGAGFNSGIGPEVGFGDGLVDPGLAAGIDAALADLEGYTPTSSELDSQLSDLGLTNITDVDPMSVAAQVAQYDLNSGVDLDAIDAQRQIDDALSADLSMEFGPYGDTVLSQGTGGLPSYADYAPPSNSMAGPTDDLPDLDLEDYTPTSAELNAQMKDLGLTAAVTDAPVALETGLGRYGDRDRSKEGAFTDDLDVDADFMMNYDSTKNLGFVADDTKAYYDNFGLPVSDVGIKSQNAVVGLNTNDMAALLDAEDVDSLYNDVELESFVPSTTSSTTNLSYNPNTQEKAFYDLIDTPVVSKNVTPPLDITVPFAPPVAKTAVDKAKKSLAAQIPTTKTEKATAALLGIFTSAIPGAAIAVGLMNNMSQAQREQMAAAHIDALQKGATPQFDKDGKYTGYTNPPDAMQGIINQYGVKGLLPGGLTKEQAQQDYDSFRTTYDAQKTAAQNDPYGQSTQGGFNLSDGTQYAVDATGGIRQIGDDGLITFNRTGGPRPDTLFGGDTPEGEAPEVQICDEGHVFDPIAGICVPSAPVEDDDGTSPIIDRPIEPVRPERPTRPTRPSSATPGLNIRTVNFNQGGFVTPNIDQFLNRMR
jgi:hypothetical protein